MSIAGIDAHSTYLVATIVTRRAARALLRRGFPRLLPLPVRRHSGLHHPVDQEDQRIGRPPLVRGPLPGQGVLVGGA